MRNNRIEYFDFLKGIAIMMVIAIHTFPSISDYYSISSIIIVLIRQILNSAVPLFLAISGYFMAQKRLDNRKDIMSFWKKQIPRVFIPMVIWGTGWFLISIYKNHETTSIIRSTINLFTGGFSVYYFVTLIIQCYIILPYLNNNCKLFTLITCGILSTIAIVATTYYLNIEGKSFPLLLYAGPVYLWAIFFMLGIYMSKNPHNNYCTYGIILSIIGFILQMIESWYYLSTIGKGLGIKTSSFIFSLGIILIALSNKTQNKFNSSVVTHTIAWLGTISFGIYLIHMYFVAIFKTIIESDNWLITWCISTVSTVILILIMLQFLPHSTLKKYFGLL